MYNKDVCVVILTGGLSKRIGGGNKSLIEFNNKIIFDRIYNNIKKQTKKIIINNNKEKKFFNNYNEIIVSDDLRGFLGPLSGIHSAMKWIKYKEIKFEWLVSIPGDTPFIPNNLVKKLLEKAISENCKIVLAKSFGKYHPVIGIWNLSLYDDLEKSLKSGVRKILHWASKHTLSYENFDNPNYDPFFNINYKEDILKAEEIENKYFK